MTTDPYRLIGRIQQVAHLLRRHSDQLLLEQAGVTTAQAAILSVVGNAPGCPQREIARRLRLGEPAVVTGVNRLLEAGLITRTRSARDARAAALSLTSKGVEVTERAQGSIGTINQLVLDALGPAGRTRFSQLLDDLDRALTCGPDVLPDAGRS